MSKKTAHLRHEDLPDMISTELAAEYLNTTAVWIRERLNNDEKGGIRYKEVGTRFLIPKGQFLRWCGIETPEMDLDLMARKITEGVKAGVAEGIVEALSSMSLNTQLSIRKSNNTIPLSNSMSI